MTRLILGLILLFFTTTKSAVACSCGDNGEFMTVAPKSSLVALVQVTKYLTFSNIYGSQTPMSMEVQIVDIYKGNEERKIITVWGDNGILCRPYLGRFDTTKYYVIAFQQGSSTRGHQNEKETDYAISICGTYWLTADITNNTASGSVSADLSIIKLSDLKQQIHHNIDNLSDLKSQDYKEIFQLILDLPKLQTYYHVDNNINREKVYFQKSDKISTETLNGVLKFGNSVTVLTEQEIKSNNITNYFVIEDLGVGHNSIRINLYYLQEGLKITCFLNKENYKWKVERYYLTEK